MPTVSQSVFSFVVSEQAGVRLTVPDWSGFDWLWHGFSTRIGGLSRAYLDDSSNSELPGELNLGFTALDLAENVRENRLRFAEAVTGSRETPLVTVRQVHSCQTILADGPSAVGVNGVMPEADGLMTAQPGLLIGIQTADCIPVLVADPVKRAVAAFHAGWRGTQKRIVEQGIAGMCREFGSQPADLVAAIGPGIGPCCYTVGAEVIGQFRIQFMYAEALFSSTKSDNTHGEMQLNLIEANRRQLLDAGLSAAAITIVGGCSACQPHLFFSHRNSGGRAGRMMAVIGIR